MEFLKKNWGYLVIALIIAGFVGIVIYNKQETKKEEDSKLEYYEKSQYTDDEYFELGKYKGVEIEKTIATVTDKELQEEIDEELTDYKNVKREAKEGDVVCIDFTTYVDGKKDKVLSTKNWEILVGDNEICAEFDEAVIGKKKGDTIADISVSDLSGFPELESDGSEYAGKKVVSEIYIKYVSEKYMLELTDEWVMENYGDEYDCTTVEEYRQMMYDDILEANQETAEYDAYEAAWDKVLASCILKKYPAEVYNAVVEEDDADIAYQADYWGMTEEEYCEFFEINREELYEKDVKSKLAVSAIAEAEGISVTEEDIENGYLDLYEEYEFDSVEEMKAVHDDTDIEFALLEEAVMDLVYENAIIKEVNK